MPRYELLIDADAADTDAATQLLDCARAANVTFTNVAEHPNHDARFSSGDTLLRFDATPADVAAYCAFFDFDADDITPVD